MIRGNIESLNLPTFNPGMGSKMKGQPYLLRFRGFYKTDTAVVAIVDIPFTEPPVIFAKTFRAVECNFSFVRYLREGVILIEQLT